MAHGIGKVQINGDCIMKSILFAALLLSMSVKADAPPDDEGIAIAIKCGTLKGVGAVLLIDKSGDVQTLPFSCPSATT